MRNLLKDRIASVSSQSGVYYGSALRSVVSWYRTSSSHGYSTSAKWGKGDTKARAKESEDSPKEEETFLSSGFVERPLSEILKQLNKKVPDSLVKLRIDNGLSTKYIPWHIVNRIMNLHAPEWSGEIRSVSYSPDGKTVCVVYRVTLYGTDAEIYRESTGSARMDEGNYGDPVQIAEAMAFRRACARFGLGLHLYHEDML